MLSKDQAANYFVQHVLDGAVKAELRIDGEVRLDHTMLAS